MRWILLLLLVATVMAGSVVTDKVVVRAGGSHQIYLPIVARAGLSQTVFGVQSNRLSRSPVLDSAKRLGMAWVRIQGLSWRQVQPERSGRIDWRAASEFEQDLLAASDAGMTPTVVIWDSPAWATLNTHKITSCGAIRDDRFTDFAEFLRAAVERYSQPPYHVRYWELGNEPDVDPRIPPANAVWGCWGNADDAWYGGEHYGRMLRAVAPAIRAADPDAKIVFGGLLLDRPNSPASLIGKPESFLEGALRAGAAGSFDILAFHAYAGFAGYSTDTDLFTDNVWPSDLGRIRGKAAFLRSVMARYGVNKPLWANEIGLICFYCNDAGADPPAGFLKTQADLLPRLYARAMSVNVQQVAWYMLEDSHWLLSSLMGWNDVPRPAYFAYRELIRRAGDGPVAVDRVGDYGPNIEAYRFHAGGGIFDLAWSNTNEAYEVQVPVAVFGGAYARDGAALAASSGGGYVRVTIGFSPVYISRLAE